MLPALVVMFAAGAVFGGYSGTDHNIDFSMCDALIPSWGECLTIGPHNAYFLHYCLNNGFINGFISEPLSYTTYFITSLRSVTMIMSVSVHFLPSSGIYH